MRTAKKGRIMFAFILSLILFAGIFSPGALAEGQNGHAANEAEMPSYIPGEYIVKYKEGNKRLADNSILSTNSVMRVYKAEIEHMVDDGTALIKIDNPVNGEQEEAFISAFVLNPSIEYVERNHIVTTLDESSETINYHDPFSGKQWALENIRAAQAWTLLPDGGGKKVRAAVIDTGVDATHPDLIGRVIPGFNAVERNSKGRIYDSKDTDDDHGHGTHVSGIIAAVCDNQIGMQGIAGIADVEILPVKVLNDEGRGSNYDVLRGIRYAADNGATILNLSLGSNFYSQAEADAVYYAQQKGCLVVAAAGNDSTDVRGQYPASYENVISVGATDRNNNRAYFSNYGETLDITAPGQAILSCIPKSTAIKEKARGEIVYGNDREGYYIEWSGTSMACPYVVGIAVLYKAANPLASPLDIENQLFATANDIGELGRDVETGRGLVDAAAVMGEDAVNKSLLISYPTQNKELYEETSLGIQISTSKGIENVRFYLNEISKANEIAKISCNEVESFYQFIWDTKTVADGEYQLIAAAYNDEGDQVGDSQQVGITILNSITNGFTLKIADPSGRAAARGEVYVFGENEDGYKKLITTYTTELGYARIKGLEQSYNEYSVVIHGGYSENGVKSYFVYKQIIDRLGGTHLINGEDARMIDLSITGKEDTPLPEPYVRLAIRGDKGNKLTMLPVWRIYDKSNLYLSDGLYDLLGYWVPGNLEQGNQLPSYYMIKTHQSVSEENAKLALNNEECALVSADYKDKAGMTRGILSLKGLVETGSDIPFLNGVIRGNSIYVPYGSYNVSAIIESLQGNKSWSFELRKQDAIDVKGNQQLDFGTEIGINQFVGDVGLKEEGGSSYLNRGDILRTINDLGDKYGNIIENTGFNYPEFTIYKMDDEAQDVVYRRNDIFQTGSSYWNSAKDFIGKEPPQEGNYRAELMFDAGPFGGISKKTFDFVLREKDGQSKTDVIVKKGENTIAPNALLTVYRWESGDNPGWIKSSETIKADSDGRLAIPNNISLSPDEINVAIVSHSQLKNGYQTPHSSGGFLAIPFSSLSELGTIDLSETVAVDIKVNDKHGNAVTGLKTPVNFPVFSDGGGKLAKAQPVTDVEINVRQTYGDYTVYIPKGNYPYVYSNFNYGGKGYFLMGREMNLKERSEIILDGRNTENISVSIPENFKGEFLKPNPKDINVIGFKGHDLTIADTYYWTKGIYHPNVVMLNSEGDVRYTVALDNRGMDLGKPQKATVGRIFNPIISLNQERILENQQLIGEIAFMGENGNQIVAIEKLQQDNFTPYYPTIVLGTSAINEKEIGGGTFGEFTVQPGDYYGKQLHYVYLKYNIEGTVKESMKIEFAVGEAQDRAIVPIAREYYTFVYEDSNAVITFNQSDVKGYRYVTVQINEIGPHSVIFTHIRNDKEIGRLKVSSQFDNTQPWISVGFNIRPGDKIVIPYNN